MRPRTTIWLAAASLVLTAYILVFESSSPQWIQPGRAFRDLSPEDVVRLEITRSSTPEERSAGVESAPITVVKESDDRWKLTRPVEFRALLPRVQGLVWTLVDLVPLSWVEEGTEAHELAIPRDGPLRSARFATRSGGEHVVEIGRDYPGLDDTVYARIDGRVAAIRRRVSELLDVRANDLRSRALVPVAPVDAVAFRLRRQSPEGGPPEAVELRRDAEGSRWRFAGTPPDLDRALADRAYVEEMLLELNSWRIASFVQDAEGDRPPYGLANPRLVFEVTHFKGAEERDRNVVVELGTRFDSEAEKLVYARHAGTPHVFAVPAAPMEWLEKPFEDLRTRYVFDLQSSNITEALCRGPKTEFVLKQMKEPDPAASGASGASGAPSAAANWRLEERKREKTYPGDPGVIERSLGELHRLLIEEYVDAADVPQASSGDVYLLSVELETGRRLELRLSPYSDGRADGVPDLFLGSRSEDPSHFLVVSPWPGRIDRGVSYFRWRRISDLTPGDVLEVRVEAGGSAWQLGRVPGSEWMLTADQELVPEKRLEEKLLNDLLGELHRERFEVYEFHPEIQPDEYGLHAVGDATSRWSIRFLTFRGQEPEFRWLRIGDRQQMGDAAVYYARAANCDQVFTVTAPSAERLHRLVEHLRDITGEP